MLFEDFIMRAFFFIQRKHLFWVFLNCLWFLLIPRFGVSQALFSVVENVRLTNQQQHYVNTFLKQPTTAGYQIVEVDFEVLSGPRVLVNSDDGRLVFTHTRTTYRDHDDYSWAGELNGSFGRCNLVVRKDQITGQFRVPGKLFQLFPLGGGLHIFVHTSLSLFPNDCGDASPPAQGRDVGPVPPGQGLDPEIRHDRQQPGWVDNFSQSLIAGPCKLRLLVAYTDDVDGAYADIQGFIQSAIDDHNDANDNSQVNHDVELARSMEVSYNESPDDLDVFLDDFMTDGDGKMDAVHDDRRLFDADVCVLLTLADGGACGLAGAIGASYSDAFCVTVAGCAVGNHSFAHEVGHLHGCRHDTYVDNNSTPYAYGHGYVYLPDEWRTIMAYNNECDCSDEVTPCPARADRVTPGEPWCDRLQNWSTPDVSRDGVAMGTASTEKNERVLDQTAATLAGFEGYILNKSVYDQATISSGEEFDIQGYTSLSTQTTDPFVILSGAKGTFRAGTEITLREGFHARFGSEFRAFLDNCDNLTVQDEHPQVAAREKPQKRIERSNHQILQLSTFPNPFHDQFRIRFRITQQAEVSIALHDIQGRLIDQILDAVPVSAGQIRQISWQASGLAAGSYYLTFRAGKEVLTKTILKTN